MSREFMEDRESHTPPEGSRQNLTEGNSSSERKPPTAEEVMQGLLKCVLTPDQEKASGMDVWWQEKRSQIPGAQGYETFKDAVFEAICHLAEMPPSKQEEAKRELEQQIALLPRERSTEEVEKAVEYLMSLEKLKERKDTLVGGGEALPGETGGPPAGPSLSLWEEAKRLTEREIEAPAAGAGPDEQHAYRELIRRRIGEHYERLRGQQTGYEEIAPGAGTITRGELASALKGDVLQQIQYVSELNELLANLALGPMVKKLNESEDPQDKIMLANLLKDRVEKRMAERVRITRRDPGEDEVTFTLPSSYGGEIPINVKDNLDGVMSWMRQKLADAESRAESFTADVNAGAIQEVLIAIRALREAGEAVTAKDPPAVEDLKRRRRDNPSKGIQDRKELVEWAEKMQSEFEARLHLHEFSLVFGRTTDQDQIDNASKLIKAKHFNIYFDKFVKEREGQSQDPEILIVMGYYLDNIDRWLTARGEGKEAFRLDVMKHLWEQVDGKKVDFKSLGREELKKVLEELQGRWGWAQNMGERILRESALVGLFDRLKPDDPKQPGGPQKFVGDADNGDSVVRRAVLMQKALTTAEPTQNVWRRILKGVDLGNRDFISALWGKIADYEKGKEVERRMAQGMSEAEAIDETEEWWLEVGAKEFTGVDAKALLERGFGEMDRPPGKKKEYKYPSLNKKAFDYGEDNLTYAQIVRQSLQVVLGYDFSKLGEDAFSDYISRSIISPDKVRAKATADSKSFLRHPTVENLTEIIGMLGYRGVAFKGVKNSLITNTGIYWSEDQEKHTGEANEPWEVIKARLNTLADAGYITAKEKGEIERGIDKIKLKRWYNEFTYYVDIWAILFAILGTALKQGLQVGK